MDLTIIYSNDCPHCHELLDKLKTQEGIEGYEINLVELSSEEANKIIENTVIDKVPLAMDENGAFCEITYIGDNVEIICPKNN